MKRLAPMVMLLVLAVTFTPILSLASDWAISGDYAESCSCNVPCPCLFGSSPSKGHCDVNGFMQIKNGHLGDVNVDGVTFSFSGRLGKWAQFYFAEGTTKSQADAVLALMQLPETFGPYLPKDIEYYPFEFSSDLSIERGDGTVKFSTPESTVTMEPVKGLDGTPIRIQNFGMKVMEGHQQYKSTANSHKSGHDEFSYSGTNALITSFSISGS